MHTLTISPFGQGGLKRDRERKQRVMVGRFLKSVPSISVIIKTWSSISVTTDFYDV